MSTEDKNGNQGFSFEISEYDPDNEGLDKNTQQINENNKIVGDSDNQRLSASIDVLLQSKETKEFKEVLPIKEEDLEQLLNKLPKELQSKVKKTKQTIDKEDDSWKIDFVVELNRSISRQLPSKSDRLNVSIPTEKSIISEEELEIQLDQYKDAEEKRQKKLLGEDSGIDEEMTEEEMRKQETRKLLRDTRNRANSKGEEESSKKFKVVRYVPEGPMNYNSIKFVGITFSQPLVPEGKDIDYLTWRPIITPIPLKAEESKWILHNQYTLIYECPEDSWANSHEYTVKIASTTAVSALNQKLNRDFEFSFRTPTISTLDIIPSFNTERERLNPFFFIGFDQQIDANAFVNQLKSFILIDRNTKEYSSMVLVDPFKETMDNQEIKELAKKYKEGYYVSFRSTIPFPHSSIVILPLLNIASMEGPLVSQDINAITFLTVDPLSVYGSHCYIDHTNEIEFVYLTFNQPIATDQQSNFESLRWKPLIGPEPPYKGIWSLENKYTLKLSKTKWANATHYTITLPIGTPSGKDDILLTDYVYHFNTEPVSLLKMHPSSGYLGLLPIMICCFDQVVDSEEIAKNIKFYVGGLLGTKNSARLATSDEIKALSDPTLKKIMTEEKEGYYVVFTTIKPFLYDSQITIKLGPNVPSKEGPLLSPIERTFTFSTISPFAISSANYSNGSVNITFNQDLIYDTQPIDITELKWRPTITPSIGKPDQWKLVSPKQLVLIPDPPFPNSTSYTVKIPSGITSIMNDTLSKEFIYSFVTGLIRLLQKYPNPSSNTALSSAWTTINTVLFMSFDQQIDPKEISNLIRCEAKGKKQALTLLNPNRANLEYPVIRPLLQNTQDGKWLALIPTKPFPYDSKVTVSLGPGIPSLEGPVKSDFEESFSFQTVPIFAISNYNIEFQARRIDIQFNQPLVHDNESIDHLNWRPEISPIPEGQGSWILKNPSLLSYGGDIHFTNSTKYIIKITKGCGSAMKEQFENDVIYEFSTPVVKVVKYYPKEGLHSPTPVCLVAFDQNIDSDAILKTVRFSIDPKGGVYSSARLATKEEMQEDKKLALIINECTDGKYMIFTTTKPFPRSAKVTVKMGPIISKEGPLRPTEDFTFSFFTITGLTAKVHITSASQPFAAIYIVFNQSISENDDIAMLTWRPHITPDPPQGNWIMQRSPYTTDISLIFTPEVKWKRSTKYTVKVPAGVISVYKEALPRESIMEFSTPTTQVEKPFPITNTSFPVKTNPVLVVKFDQIIDPEEVIKVVKFKTSTFNSALLNARLATKAEIEKEETLKNLVLDNFFLAFCPLKPFPNNEKVTCTIGPNIPSADGPIKSLDKFSFNFQTIPPFMPVSFSPIDRARVNIGTSLNINFTNTIDASSFDTTTMLKIDPPIPGAQIQMSGKTFTIKGTEFNPHQNNEDLHYKIIISRGLKDEYEQLLDKEVEYHVTLCCTSFFCSLVSPAQGVVTYDPLLSESTGKSPTFLVQATNYKEIRILLYKLDPFTDLRKWHSFEQNIQLLLREKSDQIDYLGFGKLVSDKIVKIESFKKFATTNINIDLSPALEDDKRTGQVGVIVCPTIKAHYPNEWQLRPIVKAWIQCTSMSLEVIQGLKEMYIWATDLVKGGPLSGVKIEKLERLEVPVDPLADSHSGTDSMRKSMPLERPKTPQVTNKDGLLILPHPTTSSAAIIAQKGKDIVFMEGITSIIKGNSFTKLLWHIFDDRSMYRPTEDVKIKGYVRWLKLSESDRLEKLELPSFNKIYYKVYDSLGNDYFQDEVFISNIYASFLITIPLSDWDIANTTLFIDFDIDTPIGDYYKYTHSVYVQDLRPPEQLAQTSLNNNNNNPITFDSKPIIKTQAKFFNGNALAEQNVTWNVTSQPAVFIPPGLPSSFVFTIPEYIDVKGQSNVVCKRSLTGITDDDGSNYIKIMFKGISDPPQPVNIFCLSEVQGINNMLLRSATRFILHPCDYYVGLSLGKEGKAYFSEPYNIEIVVTDTYGNCVPDIPIILRMRKQIKPKTGSVRLSKKIKEISLVSQSTPISYTILSQRVNCVGYQLMCIVKDSKNRMNSSRAFLPVRAPSQSAQQLIGKKFGRVELDNVVITSDKTEYEIGDTAKLTVESPFSPCDGLISIRSNTILKVVYFNMEHSKQTVKVQITEEYAPNVLIQIDLVGKSSRRNYSSIIDLEAPKRPAMASGNITLNIPPLLKQLDLVVAPMDPNIEPGGETTVEVQVLDSFKQPFPRAEVALLVVDEAILSLTGYDLSNPLNTFYPVRGDLFNSKRYSIRSIMPIEYLKPKSTTNVTSSPSQEREYRSEGDSEEEANDSQDLTPQQQAAITTLNRSTMTPSRDTLHDIPEELRTRLEEILKTGEGSDTIIERASSINNMEDISLTGSTEKRNRGRKSIGFSLGKLVDSLDNTPMKGKTPGSRRPSNPSTPLRGSIARGASLDLNSSYSGLTDSHLGLSNSTSNINNNNNVKEPQEVYFEDSYNPVAYFSGALTLDKYGRSSVRVVIPNRVSKFKIWAIAVSPDGKQFGIGDSLLASRLPFSIRAIPPTYLNYNDNALIPFTIQNLTDKSIDISLAIRAVNAYLGDKNQQKLGFYANIPAQSIRTFPVLMSTISAGRSTIQFTCVTDKYSESHEFNVHVYPPFNTETIVQFSDLRKYEQSVLNHIEVPLNADKHYGGIKLTMSAAVVHLLADSVSYLCTYPYMSSELLASKLLVLLALHDKIDVIKKSTVPKYSQLKKIVVSTMKAFKERQNADGGYGLWRSSDSNEFLSIHIAHAIAVCKDRGYITTAISKKLWFQKLLKYIINIEEEYSQQYDDPEKIALLSYFLYVKYKLQRSQEIKEEVEKFYMRNQIDSFPLEALGWVLSVLSDTTNDLEKSRFTDEIASYINKYAIIDINNNNIAYFNSYYEEPSRHLLFHTPLRTDSVLLDALISADIQSPIIPKLASHLLNSMKCNHWSNTQENCWATLALDKYFHVFENEGPDYTVRIWNNTKFCGETKIKGLLMTETMQFKMTMQSILDNKNNNDNLPTSDILLQKEGSGKLFYRLSLYYAPQSLDIVPHQFNGIEIYREITPVESKEDLSVENNVYQVKLQKTVKITLTIKTLKQRHFVALIDKFAAGFKYCRSNNEDTKPWFDGKEKVAESSISIFSNTLNPGTYTYSYIVKACTVGNFVLPPARIEEMYRPDIHGQSSSCKLSVNV